jgi:hypothetical protein
VKTGSSNVFDHLQMHDVNAKSVKKHKLNIQIHNSSTRLYCSSSKTRQLIFPGKVTRINKHVINIVPVIPSSVYFTTLALRIAEADTGKSEKQRRPKLLHLTRVYQLCNLFRIHLKNSVNDELRWMWRNACGPVKVLAFLMFSRPHKTTKL